MQLVIINTPSHCRVSVEEENWSFNAMVFLCNLYIYSIFTSNYLIAQSITFHFEAD